MVGPEVERQNKNKAAAGKAVLVALLRLQDGFRKDQMRKSDESRDPVSPESPGSAAKDEAAEAMANHVRNTFMGVLDSEEESNFSDAAGSEEDTDAAKPPTESTYVFSNSELERNFFELLFFPSFNFFNCSKIIF